MKELDKTYKFDNTEVELYRFWKDSSFFHAQINPDKKPFVITIPPPNVTGILHMGHALNNTIQDILIRYKKMCGQESLWMPGTDHAGIATQNVVERQLAKEKLTRDNLGREKFIERVWEWKQEYGSTIIRQLKRLGCACDWQRERFTMDDGYSDAVLEVFVRLYKKGLIYRGNYIINWCPRCQTALSDEEAPHKEVDGFLYHIKYPFKDSDDYIVVATTRPETMLGDTAVAVNPKDKRYKKLIGKTVILPLMGREIKIIKDDFVDPKFGTGAVKVTPAHDPNDYNMGKRHKLEFVNILHPDARLNENAGDYAGSDRFEARGAIIEDLKERGLLLKVEPHRHAVGHCYRCHTIIEPYLSLQWFVKMKPLSIPAIRAVKQGKIKFHPPRWTKVYLNWMDGIQDWCISRQIWWGHRIPVYYCKKCQDKNEDFLKGAIVAKYAPKQCPDCGGKDIVQDEDVLDTWFSSWLWPFATFGWPFTSHKSQATGHKLDDKNVQRAACSLQQNELKYFYPTSVLVTAQEIIFFWVARMIMAGMEFIEDIPFTDVYIHGTVRDKTGKKMSKSLGNIIDPLEIIDEYGADALRFSLISITSMGQDVFLSKDKFELGRNFANKVWNASRFILMNLDREQIKGDLCVFFKKEDLATAEAWILSRLYSTLKKLNKALNSYRFSEAASLLYEFFWHQFCDWYIEQAKLNIKDKQTQFVLYKVLEKTLRVLHPFMPFLTDEIWQKLSPQTGSIMQQSWPHVQENIIDKTVEEEMQLLIDITTATRNLRSEKDIKPKQKININIAPENKQKRLILEKNKQILINASAIGELTLEAKSPFIGETAASAVASGCTISMPLGDLLDVDQEKQRLQKQITEVRGHITNYEQRLKNKQFVNNAPEAVVEKERQRLKEAEDKLAKLIKSKDELKKEK